MNTTTDMLPTRRHQHRVLPQARPKILLIDDSPDNLLILGDILTACGYEVLFAESGMSGLERVRSVKPDLILMDVRMPGIDGLDACRTFKSQDNVQDVPVILMSAQRGGTLRQDALNAGSLDCWEKPLSPDFLRDTLKKILPLPPSGQTEGAIP